MDLSISHCFFFNVTSALPSLRSLATNSAAMFAKVCSFCAASSSLSALRFADGSVPAANKALASSRFSRARLGLSYLYICQGHMWVSRLFVDIYVGILVGHSAVVGPATHKYTHTSLDKKRTSYRQNASKISVFRTISDCMGIIAGAQKRTRTFTAIRPLRPERSASTNSAIWARDRERV